MLSKEGVEVKLALRPTPLRDAFYIAATTWAPFKMPTSN